MDKLQRIYWFEKLSIADTTNKIYLFVGFSKKEIYHKANNLLLFNIYILSITALLSLGVGLVFGERFIVEPVNRLIQKIQRTPDRDIASTHNQTGLSLKRAICRAKELELLSNSFDELIDKLSEREVERNAAEAEILRLNSELEIRVQERTAQLAATNKELEAFSYSVSHDLRAPLRSIDGWSLALVEDFEELIGDQGKKYIERIRSETQRMGQLIDDILKLSRITRAEMVKNRVNLSQLALKVADVVKEEYLERKVDIVVEPNLVAYADANMMEIVLTNLIGNALKFTTKVDIAKIEVGRLKEPIKNDIDGLQTFFVKDNGAGFDMAYASKLFGAFQRLHKASEFPGTGVGLATVQRIINRHDGRIWAEAAIAQGATFYFTLQDGDIKSDEI
ncbi:MAG: hypothetical protein HQK74_07325 [Desulfamplus sp.]|nr:hypothetical protein [Desulfamplus sp.]